MDSTGPETRTMLHHFYCKADQYRLFPFGPPQEYARGDGWTAWRRRVHSSEHNVVAMAVSRNLDLKSYERIIVRNSATGASVQKIFVPEHEVREVFW